MPVIIAKWTTMILGLWLIVSPFVLGVTGAGRWNSILVGVVVAVAAYTVPVRQPAA